MRQLPDEILEKINNKIQTKENGCAPRNSVWISRPQKILVDGNFIELIEEPSATVPTDFDIAVCHPYFHYEDTSIWQAQIVNDELTVKKYNKNELTITYRHIHVSGNAPIKCAIAFNGSFPIDEHGYSEFVTENEPWVFSVNSNGVLKASKINSGKPVDTLRDSGCIDVAAVRAYSNGENGVDYGLVCFYIVHDNTDIDYDRVFYRQYIDNEWKDEEEIYGLVVTSPLWNEIGAFRLQDYRIGIHIKTSTNSIYELLSKSMAVPMRNTEHISVSMTPKAVLTHIDDIL